MHSTPITQAVADAQSSIPIGVRIVLWTSVGVCLLVALTIGIMLIAGNNSKQTQLWKCFLIGSGVALIAQGGYFAAPFAIGRSWWLWALLSMIPIVLLVLMAISVPVLGALKWTRPDGASGWKTIAGIGWSSAIGFLLYVMPPVLMWMYRPSAGK